MWKIKHIYAKNLCAFKEMDYSPLQNCTTLVFGNNMDNDSQGSNGSGKSAMLEAIAIGLTGEPLRKIKMEEIINDEENEATVSVILSNELTGTIMTVNRQLSRKTAQGIQIFLQCGSEIQEIKEATVADYNKYVLDAIGLTKDDLYANFILSKNKYTSFLSCSDRQKKEIINRFSNGNLVDESIAILQADLQPIEQSLSEATTEVAVMNGRIDTLRQQINLAMQESMERSQKKTERIAEWKRAIADKRAYIREQNGIVDKANKLLDEYAECDNFLQDTEDSKKSLAACYKAICKRFSTLNIELPQDYTAQVEQKQQTIKELDEQLSDVTKQATKNEKALERSKDTFEKIKMCYSSFEGEYNNRADSIQNKIDKLLDSTRNLERENDQLNRQLSQLVQDIATLEKQLAGVIECPKCKHEFTLGNSVNIKEARLKLQDRQGEAEDIISTMKENKETIDDYISKGREVRAKQNKLIASKTEWLQKLTYAQEEIDRAARDNSIISTQAQQLTDKIAKLTKEIENSKTHLFDESYELLDSAYKVQENAIKTAQLSINNALGAVQSYEESIRDIEHASETDVANNLKNSLVKYEKELEEAVAKQEAVQQKLNEYKKQEAVFTEFKTYLANTKIEALNHITNEFLEAIGSDIKISLSGFTALKSGKIRDKISISLLRDGIDCGSFDKFSAGERARVELATILAMNKLTNSSCDDEKGLDLLILDEILEAVDEQGLNNIFNALNHLKITSLVVSHGNIAEGYPYRTVVNKLNGISYLNEQQ